MHRPFATYHLQDEAVCVETLLGELKWDADRARRISIQAELLIRSIRSRKSGLSEIESFLEQYPLSSNEGLALMTLAEALLRIPDTATADRLIAEKMTSASWQASGKTTGLMKFAGLGLGLAQKTLGSFLGDIGRPIIRKSLEEAIKRIGQQFVVGETIQDALRHARKHEIKGYRMSYDMLGEGARTREDAERYFDTYYQAIETIAKASDPDKKTQQKPGISVKLSALHPRYNWLQKDRCFHEMVEKLTFLCQRAAQSGMTLTVDAEEADRLELSLEIMSAVASRKDLGGWEGLGLAVQAYDKRCFGVVDTIADMANQAKCILQVRLVKGAYWDSEIKRSQISGMRDYPLFTRKYHTDLSYMACAHKLLLYRPRLYPMFATHNAQTVAGVLDLAGDDRTGFEFQRLFGMGEALWDTVLNDRIAPVTIYAPVGSHQDLLPYLVRRMLENGANTSFLNKIRDKSVAVDELTIDPVIKSSASRGGLHPRIPLPQNLFGPSRRNSTGYDLSAESERTPFLDALNAARLEKTNVVTPIINGEWPIKGGSQHAHMSPVSQGEFITEVWDTTADKIEKAFSAANEGFSVWSKFPPSERADILLRLSDLLEANTPRLIAILQQEGGKTLSDSIAEIREAVDFCRYYATEGKTIFTPSVLPGPTGEENTLRLTGRGIFVCISPWNFPLAIFTGQIAAALMAGNAVIAKPAEQTPLIAFETIRLLLQAGLPVSVITLLPGDGKIGSALISHKDVAGVAFTGSTEVARSINRALAAKDGPIVPLIAETGGQNAMIVDSSALPEQVVDDVILSAFGSAGQRCSALRVLYLQEDVADKVISILKGAMAELVIGDPRNISTDIGPVIDSDALQSLMSHMSMLESSSRLIAKAPLPQTLTGFYFAPVAYEIETIKQITREIFGPVLHVIRYAEKNKQQIIEDINNTGFGLTFGYHSRLLQSFDRLADKVNAGNIYINRSMTGAVVGVQPFGGTGLSGTGPKAGGPYYLHRFATEKTVSINTTATGGNIALIDLAE